MPKPAWAPDEIRKVEEPFNLEEWLDSNMKQIDETGMQRMFDVSYQSDVLVLGRNAEKTEKRGRSMKSENAETFLWQLRGQSKVTIDGKQYDLQADDTLLIPENKEYEYFCQNSNSATLSTLMDPKNKARIRPQQ